MESGSQVLTGVLANVSATGALLTNPHGDLDVGATGRIRLMSLSQVLRTAGADSIRLEAEIVRKEMRGFGIRFLGDRAELEALLMRAFGRSAIEYD